MIFFDMPGGTTNHECQSSYPIVLPASYPIVIPASYPIVLPAQAGIQRIALDTSFRRYAGRILT
jgi:hypothetical protein